MDNVSARAMRALALVAALVLAGCAAPADPLEGPESALGDGQGPAWSLAAIDGQTYTRDEPAGKATVLFFMATWCGSCRSKAPLIADVVADYTNESVRIYSVDFDPSETADDLRAWQERYQQPWPHGVDTGQRIQRTFGVTTQSTVLVLDGEGKVAHHFGYGRVSEASLRDALDALVAA